MERTAAAALRGEQRFGRNSMMQAFERSDRRWIALIAMASAVVVFALGASSALAASGSAEDQYVGTVPGATGDQSPSDSLTPISNSDGVVTRDSVQSAAEKAKKELAADNVETAGSGQAGA